MARPGVLEKLNQQFRFALFTGRPKEEAELTLQRFAPELVFDPIVGMDEVQNAQAGAGRPAEILMRTAAQGYYVGDTVDDARCARAAGVPFIGIAAPAQSALRRPGLPVSGGKAPTPSSTTSTIWKRCSRQ